MNKRNVSVVDVESLVPWTDAPRSGTSNISHFAVDEDLNGCISIWRGDITRLKVDAIVNAANTQLAEGGGICGAIFAAAGPKLPAACAKLGGCPTGSAKVTQGFNLPCKYILHAVGPVYESTDRENSRQLLTSCYASCLDQGTVFNMRSIAFCCISTGIYGYPKEEAAKAAFGTIRSW